MNKCASTIYFHVLKICTTKYILFVIHFIETATQTNLNKIDPLGELGFHLKHLLHGQKLMHQTLRCVQGVHTEKHRLVLYLFHHSTANDKS